MTLSGAGFGPHLGRCSLNGVGSTEHPREVWSGFGNPGNHKPYLDLFNAPKEYFNGVKYGSPGGLMQILR
jgi:hypothetical protein